MTPLAIGILLHCYTSQAPVPNPRAPAVKSTIIMLIRERMILPVQGINEVYATTERGVAHVVQLCMTAAPRQQWLDSHGKAIDLDWGTHQNAEPLKPVRERVTQTQDQLSDRMKRELDNVVVRHNPNTQHTAELGGADDTPPPPPLPAAPSCECNAADGVHHPNCPASEFRA